MVSAKRGLTGGTFIATDTHLLEDLRSPPMEAVDPAWIDERKEDHHHRTGQPGV